MPVWNITIKLADIWGGEFTIPKRDLIVERIKKSRWSDITSDREEYDSLIEELSESLNKYEFNSIWNKIYDLADIDRVWIETF